MSLIAVILVAAIPAGAVLLLPALGELLSERSGIINLGTEGAMLTGALTAFAVGSTVGSPALGCVAGALAAALCGLLHSSLVVLRGANQLASGLTVWFLALGVTSVVGTSYTGKVITPLPTLPIPGLSALPVVGTLFNQNLLVYAAYLLVPAMWAFLTLTRPGLQLRAAGERPEVLLAAGHSPTLRRIGATTAGSALAGLGGAQLSVGMVGNWAANMTNGYGFIAAAVVMFALWKPAGVMAGALLFGATLALAATLQARGHAVNQYVLDALPYLITLIVLVVVSAVGRSHAPEAQRDVLSQTR